MQRLPTCRLRFLALVGAVVLAGCNESPAPVPPPAPPPPAQSGVNGTINGSAFTATSTTVTYDPATQSYNWATATVGGLAVGLFLEGITQAGSYPLHTVNPFRYGFVHSGGVIYATAPTAGGPGQVTVTVATPTRIAGSANYVASDPQNPSGPSFTTSFTFDLAVTETGPLLQADAAVRGDDPRLALQAEARWRP